MADTTPNEPDLSIEEAINRVLLAEREATEMVQQCRIQAQQTMEQARQTANRIVNKTNDRIRWVHQRCVRAVSDEKNRIKHQGPDAANTDSQPDMVRLAQVLDEIATMSIQPARQRHEEHNTDSGRDATGDA